MITNYQVFAHCAEGKLVEISPKKGKFTTLKSAMVAVNDNEKIDGNTYFSIVANLKENIDDEIKTAIVHLLSTLEDGYYVKLSNGYMLTLTDYNTHNFSLDLTTTVEVWDKNFDCCGSFEVSDYVSNIVELLMGFPVIDEMSEDIEGVIAHFENK